MGKIPFGWSSTAADEPNKEASINGITLAAGLVIAVTFTNGNSVVAPTLSVNGETARTVQIKNGSLTADMIPANHRVLLQYGNRTSGSPTVYWTLLNPASSGGSGSQGPQGVNGAQGPQGAAGAQGAQGASGGGSVTEVGGKPWVSGTSYVVGDIVSYNDKIYICTTANSGTSNPTTSTGQSRFREIAEGGGGITLNRTIRLQHGTNTFGSNITDTGGNFDIPLRVGTISSTGESFNVSFTSDGYLNNEWQKVVSFINWTKANVMIPADIVAGTGITKSVSGQTVTLSASGGGGGSGINVKNYTSTANSNIFEIGYDAYFISNTTNTEGGYVYLDTGNVSSTISKGQCITIGKKNTYFTSNYVTTQPPSQCRMVDYYSMYALNSWHSGNRYSQETFSYWNADNYNGTYKYNGDTKIIVLIYCGRYNNEDFYARSCN